MDKEEIYSLIENAWLNGYETRSYRPNTMSCDEHRKRNLERYVESIKENQKKYQKLKRG